MDEEHPDALTEPLTAREQIVSEALRKDSYVQLWLDPDDRAIIAKLAVQALEDAEATP